MQAGKLRKRITIQHATIVQDDFGEPIETWVNIPANPVVWASVLPNLSRSGRERFVTGASQVQAEISHVVTIRYRTDLSVKMIVLWGSRHLMIENIFDPTGKLAELVLLCREIQD